jgi:alpha-ketoglutarate-dependent taurine dioxygenase
MTAAMMTWADAVAAHPASPADAIYQGPGYVRAALAHLPADPRAHFVAMARQMGELLPQDEGGTLLLDIAEASPSDAMETSFHTDGAFAPAAPDVFGLLCLHPATSGGALQLVDVRAVLRDLSRRCPEAREVLAHSVRFDATRQVVAGERALGEVQIVTGSTDADLAMRYFRPQIDRDALSQPQRRAIAHLEDAILAAARVELLLAAGDCVFVNNRWILHNRTRFTPAARSAERRRMIRVWLRQTTTSITGEDPWLTNSQIS